MEAIVLTGGLGTRLRSITGDSTPKGLAMVRGRPILEHVLDQLIDAGVSRVCLATGYLASEIADYFKGGYRELDLVFSVEETPLGTGGAVKLALAAITGNRSLVVNGDTLIKVPLAEMSALYDAANQPVLLITEDWGAANRGWVTIQDSKVVSFHEKLESSPRLASSGVVLIGKDVFLRACVALTAFNLESGYLNVIARAGRLSFVKSSTGFIDIGSPNEFQRANLGTD